jgi:hypothetical protein
MKYQIKFIILIFAVFLFLPEFSGECQGYDINKNDTIPKMLRSYINAMNEPCNYKELPDYLVSKPPMYITKIQALEDIEMIQYLFDNAYCGRDYWQNNGIKFESLSDRLKEYVDTCPSDRIDVKTFEDVLYDYLSPINDGHTSIVGFQNRTLIKWLKPYFAEIIVEKQNNRFVVIESKQFNVKCGSEYIDSREFLFKTLSKNNTEQYLIGKLSTEKIDTLTINFNTGNILLNLHVSGIENVKVDNTDKLVQIDTIKEVPVIRTSSFIWSKGKENDLETFVNYGKSLINRPAFIWNLIANWGGDANYPYRFVGNFNGLSQIYAYVLVLHSPPSNQCYWKNKNTWLELWSESSIRALNNDNIPLDSVPVNRKGKIESIRIEKQTVKTNPRKYWEIVTKPEKLYGNYNGKAIILMSSKTASAGNNAVAISKSIPNSIIIGSNSSSSFAIGNKKNYCLKNSLIRLELPGTLTIHPDNKLEKGFLPDYWLDSEQPVQDVVDWINNPDTFQFKYKDE